MESSHPVKNIVFNQFDGTDGTFPAWKEEMELVLMANDLWCLVDPVEAEEVGDKKTVSSRTQKAFALIALNLTRSCRDVIRQLKSKDPRAAWIAVVKRFDRVTPVSKMALLDALLSLRYRDRMIEYVSEFNSVVQRLETMDIKLHEELLVAILLRGLPDGFAAFVAALKHRERVPPLDEVIAMLCAEEQGQSKAVAYLGEVVQCTHCKRMGHRSSQCWDLHPAEAICRKCKQKGHFVKNCPESRVSAEVATTYPVFEDFDVPLTL